MNILYTYTYTIYSKHYKIIITMRPLHVYAENVSLYVLPRSNRQNVHCLIPMLPFIVYILNQG